MKLIVILIGFLYRVSFQLIFNIVFNLFWLIHMSINKKWYFSERKKALAITSFFDFAYCYDGLFKEGLFKKWPTWTALIGVTYYRGKIGNCQDAAWYVKKWLKLKGEKPKIRIFMKGLHVDKVHYIVESNGYIYDMIENLNFRKRKGSVEDLVVKANANKFKIYFIQ